MFAGNSGGTGPAGTVSMAIGGAAIDTAKIPAACRTSPP